MRRRGHECSGFERFAAEHEHLWSVERRKVVAEVTVAAAHGDRSENAEYQYGKKRLREIDRRLQNLTKLLEEAVVVDPAEKKAADRAFFGCWVTVEDEDGERATYELVGPDEFDAKAGRISLDSPSRAAPGGRGDAPRSVRCAGAAGGRAAGDTSPGGTAGASDRRRG